MTSKPATTALSLFEKRVKEALKLYAKPESLAVKSPLASAYFLAHDVFGAAHHSHQQSLGQALQLAIQRAVDELWGDQLPTDAAEFQRLIPQLRLDPSSLQYAFVVLELAVLHRYIQPRRRSDIYELDHFLPGSRAQHYREYDDAIKHLAAILLRQLRPAMRLEHPTQSPELIGYETQMTEAATALARGQSVSIVGAGGVGKTSLGAALVSHQGIENLFWFTLRPNLNDNLSSLIFALAYFLHGRETSNLWSHLIAHGGAIEDANVAMALLRQDLLQLDPSPLLCFDELEYLYAPDPEHLPVARVQIFELLESLRGTTPMLLISQRPVLESDCQIELPGLATEQIRQMWKATDQALSTVDAEKLFRFTNGNPRLLVLCRALSSSGEQIAGIVQSAGQTLSLLPILNRVWRRLPSAERRLLQRLSIFRSFAPEDAFDAQALDGLRDRALINDDGRGAITLLPALREVIRGEITVERAEELHREAAIIRLERAEYTAAAYHFWLGNAANQAVQLWYPHRHFEIGRGEASAALAIFDNISRNSLDRAERSVLDLIRAELHKISGQLQIGLSNLEAIDWSNQSEVSISGLRLRGEFQEALGYPEAAVHSYRDGERVAMRLIGQLTRFHQRRGMVHLRQKELAESRRQLRSAQYDTHILAGLLHEEEGDYAVALEAFQAARALAETLENDADLALAERYISALYGRQQQLEQAVDHANCAMQIYERMGDRINLEKMRSNLAFAYVQAGQFHAAIEVAIEAYNFFHAIKDPYFSAVTGANLAEAYCEINELEAAEEVAFDVLGLEERHAHPYAHFTLGQIHSKENDPSRAQAHFAQSLRTAEMNEDHFMVAYAKRALGVAQVGAGDVDEGLHHMRDARQHFEELQLHGEVEETEAILNSINQ